MPTRDRLRSRFSRRSFLLSSCASLLALGCEAVSPARSKTSPADANAKAKAATEPGALSETSTPEESDRVFPQG